MPGSLDILQFALAAGIVLVAYLVRGISGFGSGLIAIPLLALMLPVTLVVPVISLLDYLASMAHGVKHRSAIAWREVFMLLPPTLLGIGVALYLFHALDAVLLKRFLGGFVLLYAVYALLGRSPDGNGSRWWSIPVGGIGGLINTLFGTGGPFYVIYLHVRGLDKTAFRATVATIFLFDGMSRVIGYTASGLFNEQALWLVAGMLPLMVVAMYVGGHIHTTLRHSVFQRGIGVLLVGSGLALLLS